MFADLGAKIIYIHPESDNNAVRTLQTISEAGASPAIAINPGTSVETVRPLLGLAEYILVMTVNPGFAGQKYLSFVDEKIDLLLNLKSKYGYRIMIDGACSPQKIRELNKKGADGFVLGTAALFGKDRPYYEIIRELRDSTA
jgi:ribulose-phosphate 3-epimerase